MPKLTSSPWLLATFIGSFLLVVTFFLPWQEAGDVTRAGLTGWGVAAAAFYAFAAIEAGMQLRGRVKMIPVPPPMLVLGPCVIGLMLLIIKFLVDGEARTGWAWVGLVLGVATTVAAYRNAHELLKMLATMRKQMAAAKRAPRASAPAPASPVGATGGSGTGPDGVWNITMQTPMGEQQGTLTLKTDGQALSGSAQTPFGLEHFEGGTADGGDLRWEIDATSPMPMKLTFGAKVDGDSIAGTVVAGSFGESAFSGTRA